MLMRGLDEAPETEVRNENDRVLFHRFRIRSVDVLRSTVLASRQQFVFVKPICDSQLLDTFLDLDGLAPGRGVWVYRDPDSRARSEVSKFGPANLLALRDIAAGRGETRWQGERLPEGERRARRSFDLDTMTPFTAAVLFWAIRNQLVLRPRVRPSRRRAAGVLRRVRRPSGGRDAASLPVRRRDLPAPARRARRPQGLPRDEPLEIDPRVRALATEVHELWRSRARPRTAASRPGLVGGRREKRIMRTGIAAMRGSSVVVIGGLLLGACHPSDAKVPPTTSTTASPRRLAPGRPPA